MKIAVATLAILAAASPAFAGSCSHDGIESHIQNVESEWAESVASGDISVPKRILSEDFVGVSTNGTVYDKHAALSETNTSEFSSDRLDYVHVRFHDDTAIAQGSERWTRKSGGKGHFVWIDTWMCSGGVWKIVSAVDVNVPDKSQ